MTQAIEAVFSQAQHQTCIGHFIRASTVFISHKDRKDVMAGLEPIYPGQTPKEALVALCNVQENPWVKSRLSADKSKAPWHSSDINI